MPKQFLTPPIWEGKFLKPRIPQAFGAPFYVWGHSLTGTVYNNTGATWVNRVARELDFGITVNNGFGGMSMQDVANIILNLWGEYSLSYGRFSHAQWFPGSKGIVAVMGGGNEIIQAGIDGLTAALSTRAVASLQENLRAILAGFQLANHEEIRTSSGWVASGGSWTESTSQDQASNRNWFYTQTQGATITRSVLPAGDVWIFLRSLEGSANVSGALDGGIAEILVNGVVQHTVDTNAKAYDLAGGSHEAPFGFIARKVTLTGGSSTVAIRKADAGTKFVVVDFAGYTVPVTAEPTVYYFQEYMHRDSLPGLNNSYRAAVDAVLSEFPRVVPVDMRATWDSSYVGADGVHLNDRGEAWLADLFIDKLAKTLPWSEGIHNAPENFAPFGATTPATARAYSYMPTEQDHNRLVVFSSGSDLVCRVPDGSRPIPVGFHCYVTHNGSGRLSLDTTGITLRSPNNRTAFVLHTTCKLLKIGNNLWMAEWYDAMDPTTQPVLDEAMMWMGV